MTDMEEGFNVASDIFDKKYSQQLNWSDFAVLYRTNAQSRIFEETMRRKNIPYKIYGGLSFYERKEIKDILAYFRMVINQQDEEALKRTINYPKRGIGDTTVSKILELSSEHNISAWQVINEVEKHSGYFNKGTLIKLKAYTDLINILSLGAGKTDAYTKAREIASVSGIMKELRDGKLPEEISHMKILRTSNAIMMFTEAAGTNGEPQILKHTWLMLLLIDVDNEKDEDRNKGILMTMHSAKGLEFKHVYLGMEDTFSLPMSSSSSKELEEERRLFYVALTRAEKQATLSYALNRYKWGNLERCNPSRFLREIDQEFLYYPQTGGKPFTRKRISFERPHSLNEKPSEFRRSGRFKKLHPSEEKTTVAFESNDPLEFSEGDSVNHERFGNGVIVSIEGVAPNVTASVAFENSGTKKLLLRFAKLRKL